ncbi:MAG TPA: tRNA (adenine(22)-N(1))-methyltransferase TrmK [Candidatus Dormibacteraeota bacterium]|jgi:tRNA (adenine22-N1)-methyltransferase|nr:tRNA (adenine(22)-N(1))-methyltransferase TrmK [Candidatus Dormibacteraeota bacterium]
MRAILATVPVGARSVADVGAGDGQLSRALVERGLRVIAVERGAGPYQRLCRAVAARGVDCRLGLGLDPVRPGEVEGVIMAGMGAGTMVSTLERALALRHRLSWMVLQPQQADHVLETWLNGQTGHRLRRVTLTTEGGRAYKVLLVGAAG